MSSNSESQPERLERAFAAVGSIIGGATEDQWAAPTPCDVWAVRDVVTHLAGMNRVFVAMLVDGPMPQRVPIKDGDLVAAYEESSAELVAVFRRPGLLEREFTSPMGSSTGAERLLIRMYDLLAHGWDIARATGHSTSELPTDLAEESLAFALRQVDTLPREGRFKAPQFCPDDAPALDRLAAFLGRDLSWSSSSGSGVDPR